MPDADDSVYRAAWYYYHDNLTQEQISNLLGTSRATVGRLLTQARKTGVVKITLDPGLHEVYGVGAELKRLFSLDNAVVIPGAFVGPQAASQLLHALAIAGGRFLAGRLCPGELLAIGWGNTVSRALLSLPRDSLAKVRVVTLTGGIDPYLRAQFDETSDSYLSSPGVSSMIPAPLLTSSSALARALMDDAAVRQQLDEALLADHAVVGIGSSSSNPTLTGLGYQTERELALLAKAGIVGDMLGRFFYADGSVADLPLHHRVIGTDLDQLRKMRDVIAIAGGHHKVAAISAVLRGGYVKTLVTDSETANAILSLHKQ